MAGERKQGGAIKGGYVLMARSFDSSPIASSPPHVREVWFWLIRNANFQDRTVGGKSSGVASSSVPTKKFERAFLAGWIPQRVLQQGFHRNRHENPTESRNDNHNENHTRSDCNSL